MGLKPEQVPQLTLNNGMAIPCIGLGTFGSDRVSAADVAAAVGGAIRCGYRLIDCAACYGNEKEIRRGCGEKKRSCRHDEGLE